MAAEKDTLSMNNHVVVCIFFVSYNWHKMKFRRVVIAGEIEENIQDEQNINDCDKSIF